MPAVAQYARRTVARFEEFQPDRDDVFLPSPQEIAAACQEIQAQWSETERARRARGMAGAPRGQRLVDKQMVRLMLDRRAVAEDWAA